MVLDPFMIPQKKIGALPLKIQKRTYLLLVGGWATPLKNMSSSVGITIPNLWKNKSHVPNHQTDWYLTVMLNAGFTHLDTWLFPFVKSWAMKHEHARASPTAHKARPSSPRTQRITLLQISAHQIWNVLQISAVSDWLRNCTTIGAVLLVYFSGYISGSKFGPTSGVIIIMFIHMYTINLYPFVTTFMHQRSARPTSDLSGKLWIPAGFFGCGDNDLSSRIGIVLGQDLSQPKIRGSSQGGD